MLGAPTLTVDHAEAHGPAIEEARTAGLLDMPMAPGTRITVSISELQLEKVLK